jgi:ubiquinone/menaquinone biosynthesis C-methylase UbiE
METTRKAKLFGDLSPLVPRVRDMFDGPPSLSTFKTDGEAFLSACKQICGLRPDEKVLDVGCGIGRKTVALTQYLTSEARYEGIDIVQSGIEWCDKAIHSRFPNFRFHHIDVYNKYYNPQGTCLASEYRFPFADQAFDCVIATSVFTHMLPDDLANYLKEIHRVLRPGGRSFITYFLLNDESMRLIESGDSTLDFTYGTDRYRTVSATVPESAVAYYETWIRDLYQEIPMRIECIAYGSWCARQRHLGYQDHVLGVRD